MRKKKKYNYRHITVCTRCKRREPVVRRPEAGEAFCAECLVEMEHIRARLEELRQMWREGILFN